MIDQITETTVPDQTVTLTIPPGESRQVTGLADRFYFTRASGPIRVHSGILPARVYRKGQGKQLPSPALFKRLELWNDDPTEPLRLEMEYTFGDFIDRRFIVASDEGAALGIYDIPTAIEVEATLAAGNLANATEVEFDPTPASGYMKRKYVSISNNSATARLLLLDSLDNEIGSIFPSQTNEFHHTDFFKLRNESGADVDVKAYTCWEIEPYGY